MSRKVLFLISFVLLLCFASYGFAVDSNAVVVDADCATITVDGNPAEWAGLRSDTIHQDTCGNSLLAGFVGELEHDIRFAWDNNYLYILVEQTVADKYNGEAESGEDFNDECWAYEGATFTMDLDNLNAGSGEPNWSGIFGDFQAIYGYSSTGRTDLYTGNINNSDYALAAQTYLANGSVATAGTFENADRIIEARVRWSDIANNIDVNERQPGKDLMSAITAGFVFGCEPLIWDDGWHAAAYLNCGDHYHPPPGDDFNSTDVNLLASQYLAINPSPGTPERHVVPDVNLSWDGPSGVVNPTYNVYLVEDEPNFTGVSPVATNLSVTTHNPSGDLAIATDYYWRVDVNEPNGTVHTGLVWNFETWGKAWNPSPEDQAKDVPLDTEFDWDGDTFASSFDVYLGASKQDVTDANITVQLGVYKGNYPDSNYTSPQNLRLGTHYWRIDQVNEPNRWKGDVWSFKTVSFYVFDDFDQYGSTTAMEAVWQEQAGTGADVLRQTGWPRFPGQNAGWGMKFKYDNSGTKYYSEVKREVADADKDWTRDDVKEMDLWFLGKNTNNITTGIFGMYAALEDKDGHLGVVYYGDHSEDINDIKLQGHATTDLSYWEVPDDPEFGPSVTAYRPWHIRIADFNENGGVNLADVNNFYLGFGDRTNNSVAGGTGEVWFEEFRLYQPRCLSGYVVSDLTGDCMVDYRDLRIMWEDWLDGDYNIATTNPGTSDLVAYYQFEGDYADSSGNGHHGTAVNDVSIVYDAVRDSNVLNLPGTGDYVELGGGKDPCGPNTWADLNEPITVAAWIQITTPGGWQAVITKGESAWRLQTDEDMGAYFGCTGLDEGSEEWGVYVSGGDYVSDGQWHHIAGVYDPNYDGDNTGKMFLYVNGVVEDTADASGEIARSTSTTDVTIGENLEDFSIFKGYIDEVCIYERVLSQAEIAYLAADGGNPLYVPLRSEADLYEDSDEVINYMDFAVMAADKWLEEQLFGY